MNHNEEERLVEVFLTEDGLTDMETGEPFDGKAFVLPPLGGRALFKENVTK